MRMQIHSVVLIIYCAAISTSHISTYRAGRGLCSSKTESKSASFAATRELPHRFQRRCDDKSKLCNSTRIENRQAAPSPYIEVAPLKCCPGWISPRRYPHRCYKDICTLPCFNGGTCKGKNVCICPAGFTGKQCQTDIDECISDKLCDHLCTNTIGSFYCECKKNFILQEDKQSCRREDTDEGTALEVEELDSNSLTKRIEMLEKLVGADRYTGPGVFDGFNILDLKSNLESVIKDVVQLERRFNEFTKKSYNKGYQ